MIPPLRPHRSSVRPPRAALPRPMRLRSVCLLAAALAASAVAAPLSRQLEIDFFREVPNRNLKGITVRADSRLLDGPGVSDLAGTIGADLLWSTAPSGQARVFFVGTGPEGKIFRVDATAPGAFTAELAADLEATHVFAVATMRDGALLAGTSPQGTLSLIRAGAVVAAVNLPVDSILDLSLYQGPEPFVLVATGNPGRIYRVDLAAFATAGIGTEKITDAAELAKRGITLFGEIRDRNVRRLLRLPDGRVIAGSAPRGNVYEFPAAGGAPLILLENRDAEVSDLLAGPGGSFYAALTLSAGSGDTRLAARPTPAPAPAPGAAPAPAEVPDIDDSARTERFTGRGQLVHFPAGGLPEMLITRPNTAFYRLAWHQDGARQWIVISGGEQGELLAYSPSERRSMNLGATVSAQTNGLSAFGDGLFLLLRSNAPGFSLLDFNPSGARTLETRRLDLGSPAELGKLRFGQLRGLTAQELEVSARTSYGSDEREGWSAWTPLGHEDGGWSAPDLRGRYVQFRLALPAGTARSPLIDRATLHYLPQNRRPQLTDFRIFAPNLALVPLPEPPATPANLTVGSLLFPNQRDGKDAPSGAGPRRSGFLNSPVVPQTGTQIVYWSITDPDDDTLAATFSLAPEGTDDWTDLAVRTADTYVQFDVSHLPEGRYRTRLLAEELAPRPAAQRLSYTFETDSLIVDRTPPEILAVNAERVAGAWRLVIEARDAASLLQGAEFVLNNGLRLTVEQPEDGVLDGLREAFVAEVPAARAAGATSVEIVVYDTAGNSAARRVPLP